MCRVFGNIIDNARDAILDEGSTEGKRIEVMLGETPNAFVFRVSNNGPRIPERNMLSIFQPGFTTKSDGHGSGLSIVNDIMDAYGGRITVDSTDSETTFHGIVPKKAVLPPK